ncbi:MAG: dTMP kinase [Turneriella sp.]
MAPFIVFEGIDGSGKSTTIHEISQRLSARGIAVASLREPTEKTDASREIRRILRTVREVTPQISKELLDLFFIDRLWDINNQIIPSLRAGKVVLLDRYFFSTAAYQADSDARAHEIVATYLADDRIILPELIIFLNLPVEEALRRVGTRRELDVFETETRLNVIAARYNSIFSALPQHKKTVAVDERRGVLTAQDFEELSARIAALVVAQKK